jgi:hypothetical protein
MTTSAPSRAKAIAAARPFRYHRRSTRPCVRGAARSLDNSSRRGPAAASFSIPVQAIPGSARGTVAEDIASGDSAGKALHPYRQWQPENSGPARPARQRLTATRRRYPSNAPPGDRVVGCHTSSLPGSVRLQHDLGHFILLLFEHLVALGRVLQRQAMTDQKGRIELTIQNHLQQLGHVFLHMRLAALDR